MVFANNPFLKEVASIEGAKHKLKRLIQTELLGLKSVADTGFVIRRLTVVGVKYIGEFEDLLAWWKGEVKSQMQVTHNVKPRKPKPVSKKGFAKHVAGRSVGFATRTLLL